MEVRSIRVGREMVIHALLFAVLTGIGAHIKIPFSPVPATMQVFFVLLSGLVLGPFWGPASQLLYILAGLCGAPFFAAPPHAGPIVLFGPTGGYLWGFILASGIVGLAYRRLGKGSKKRWWGAFIACLGGILAVYFLGAGWLFIWLKPQGEGLGMALELGVKPFVLLDLFKGALASLCGSSRTLKII